MPLLLAPGKARPIAVSAMALFTVFAPAGDGVMLNPFTRPFA